MSFPSNTPIPVAGVIAMGTLGNPEPKSGTIFPSKVYSFATNIFNSPEMFNPNWFGVQLFINMSAVGASGTLVVKVQTKDPISGTFVDIPGAATPSIVANAESVLIINPTTTAVANSVINESVGVSWRVVATVGVADSTFSVSGTYLVG